RSAKYISRIVLNRFLKEYQTIASAAQHLNVDEKEILAWIRSERIEPAPEGGGVLIFHRSDLLD
ncbi:MAG: helix-turn-helix domain-containing protein, partial [Cohaesibacter sp.]|nr:helix-turn-helix domain-containing protein [Cohaesibacter sp.]